MTKEKTENPALASAVTELRSNPEMIEFKQVIDLIDQFYDYSPTRFTNGLDVEDGSMVINEAGSNEGSCKIFSFAQIQQFDERLTVECFGRFYRDDVLGFPEKDDHANIRNFMRHGWAGITFDSCALHEK